jgi:hypothetical protein
VVRPAKAVTGKQYIGLLGKITVREEKKLDRAPQGLLAEIESQAARRRFHHALIHGNRASFKSWQDTSALLTYMLCSVRKRKRYIVIEI